ncbi:MAG: metalloregulator ArsR/SmtB family transcription factor [Thermodesulfobacteriota bacterium]
MTSIYKALGDPTRLKIAVALTEGEMCVCDLSVFLEISESAVSHQLRRLKDLSLIKNRREGQVLYYSLDDQHVIDFLNIGLEHIRE